MHKSILVLLLLATALGWVTAQAPDFTITDSGGKTHALYADYVNKGKVVVLEVFFINCPPCATYAPHVQALYQQMKSQYGSSVELLLLSDKSADTNPLVAQYRTSKSLTMPAAGSDGGSVSAVQPYKNGQFGTFLGTPTFIVIAPNSGQVFFDIRGASPTATTGLIAQKIADLLPACRILTPSGDTLQKYQITLSPPGGGSPSTQQVTNGAYRLGDFHGLPPLPYCEAVAAKNDNPLNGVSTFDLVLINRHVLGVEPFQHPWQHVAADANSSNTVSTYDIVELRKLILGIYDTLPQVPSWVFLPPKDTIWPQQCSEFLAIKKGDVNGTADPKGLQTVTDRGTERWPFFWEKTNLTAGQTRTVRLQAGATGEWAGFQAAFRYDARAVQILGVYSRALSGFDENAWRVSDGRLALSWFAPGEPVSVPAGATFLEIDLLPLLDGPQAACLQPEGNSMPAEVYGADGKVYSMDVQTAPPNTGAVLAPNPANGFFAISLENAAPGPAVLQLIDVQGKVVFEKKLLLESGPNRCDIVSGPLPAGVYVARLGGVVVGRLVWGE
ncbi:MAG: redoxin domain-containing protein [Saprospiraceae bacterium]